MVQNFLLGIRLFLGSHTQHVSVWTSLLLKVMHAIAEALYLQVGGHYSVYNNLKIMSASNQLHEV